MMEERVILTDYYDNPIGNGSKKESEYLTLDPPMLVWLLAIPVVQQGVACLLSCWLRAGSIIRRYLYMFYFSCARKAVTFVAHCTGLRSVLTSLFHSSLAAHIWANIEAGMLHRALSVFLFTPDGKLILQQASTIASLVHIADSGTYRCLRVPVCSEQQARSLFL